MKPDDWHVLCFNLFESGNVGDEPMDKKTIFMKQECIRIKTKKTIFVVFCVFLSCCLAACGNAGGSGSDPALIADFEGSPLSGDVPLHVAFSNRSAGKIATYLWDFGDGLTSSETNPLHVFRLEGVYTINLTVAGPEGSDTRTITGYIKAGGTHEADGGVDGAGDAGPDCTNECSIEGDRECAGATAYQVCGDYDTDDCFEWGSVTQCPSDEMCQSGDCVATGANRIGLFAINEGNFNADTDIVSIFYPCNNPSFNDFISMVEAEPTINTSRLFVSGWSCGATYALIRGYEHSDVFRGIVHIHQASIPPYQEYLEQAFEGGGSVRVPVYIVHDFASDAGGHYLKEWLLGKGYTEGVDLFVMNRPGTGHDGHLTDDEKRIIKEWIKSL